MKPLFLNCSDAHLRDRRGDEQFALSQIVSAAVRLKVDVVGAGDLFDRQSNRSAAVTFFYNELDRLAAAGRKFYYTEGQHDLDDPPWLSGHRAAVSLHKQVIDFGEAVVYGLNWQPFGKLQEALAEIPDGVNFLVCHQVWADWMGDLANPQGSFAQIPGHVRYVQTGDLHQWKLGQYKNADGVKMLVCSTGATTQQRADEPSKHHYALFYPDGRFEQKTLKSRVFYDSPVMNRPEDLDRFVADVEPTLATLYQQAAAADLPDNIMKPVVRYTHSATLTDAARRVEKAVGDRAYLIEKQLIPEAKVAAYAAARTAEGTGDAVTPLSLLGEEVDADEDQDVYSLCQLLLSSPDQEAAFARWRAEQLGDAEKKETQE